MHILTKVFIVFAAVLSLVLAALTMAYSVNADTVAGKYLEAQQAAATAQNVASASVAQYSDAAARMQEQINSLQTQLANVNSKNADLLAENARLTAEKRRAEDEAQAIKNQIGDFVETTNAQASLIRSYKDQVQTLQDSEFSLRRASLELEDRVNDLGSQNEVYEQTIRALREQVAAAQRAAERAVSGAAGLGEGEPFEAVGPVISGRITRVSTDPASGATLAEVSVGTNDRIADNMKLYVGRDGREFVATLVVVATDLQSSVARVMLVNQGMAIREGDVVVSRFGN